MCRQGVTLEILTFVSERGFGNDVENFIKVRFDMKENNTAKKKKSSNASTIILVAIFFVGLCVLWRLPLVEEAYADSNLSEMFASFYDGAASYYYLSEIAELLPLVEEGKRYGELSPLEIPYNYYYTISF